MTKNLKHKINNDTPFIYFPLHVEPERTVSTAAPFYTNQFEVIVNIAKSLPVDYKLYVKENLAMRFKAWRKTSFYKKILELPNVELFHPSFSHMELIKKSSLILTITGTTGLEGLISGKPCIVFADTMYSHLSSVTKLNSIEELSMAIKKALKIHVNVDELKNFVNIVNQNTFEFDLVSLVADVQNHFYYKGLVTDTEIKINTMKSFLKLKENNFELLANEHIKIIKQYTQKHSS